MKKTFYTIFLFSLLLSPVFAMDDSVFTDVDPDTLEGEAVLFLKSKNILNGRPDGRFDGDAFLNRAEVAKFLISPKENQTDSFYHRSVFSDIPSGIWYEKYVLQGYNDGILNGYQNGLYLPQQTVNTAEFLKIMSKSFGIPEGEATFYIDVKPNTWYSNYSLLAESFDLFPYRKQKKLSPEKNITRKEGAIALYLFLKEQNEECKNGKFKWNLKNKNNFYDRENASWNRYKNK